MFWTAFNITTVIFFLYTFLVLTWKFWKRKYSFLPCAPNLPWLGTVPYFCKKPRELYKQRLEFSSRYNHLYIYWLYHVPVIKVGCVEYLEPILKYQGAVKKSGVQMYFQEWLGDGLIVSTGQKWKKRRVAITPAFHFSILNNFVDIYEKHATNLVKKLRNIDCNKEGVEVQNLTSLVMLDVICETSMGVTIDALNTDSNYIKAVDDLRDLLTKRITSASPRFLYKFTSNGVKFYEALETLHGFTIKVINENIALRKTRRTQIEETRNEDDEQKSYRSKKKVFIDVLLDLYDKGEIDEEGIREEVDTFMAAGHDTTSTAFSWLLYEVGRHPEIQRKMQEEIDNVSLQDCSLVDKIRMLKYTECVIKESQRLNPAIPGFARSFEEDLPVGKIVIPAGTVFQVDIISVHLNPEYWDEPEVFNPTRFDVDVKRNPYSYIPFSAGPRNCIGQKFALLEEKVFIFTVLSNFDIESIQSPDEVHTIYNTVKCSENGLYIKFHPRRS